MCGLWGMVSVNSISKYIPQIEQTAIRSTVRGRDSTGIFTASVNSSKFQSKLRKELTTPFFFFTDYKKEMIQKENPLILIGHNRMTTVGKITIEAAHPFVFKKDGIITMVGAHNGTLKNYFESEKDTHNSDSEKIFHDISENGLKPSLEKLGKDSAYAFTFLDKFGTLHFFRNELRPLYLSWGKNEESLIWASDDDYLETFKKLGFEKPWILKTNTLLSINWLKKNKLTGKVKENVLEESVIKTHEEKIPVPVTYYTQTTTNFWEKRAPGNWWKSNNKINTSFKNTNTIYQKEDNIIKVQKWGRSVEVSRKEGSKETSTTYFNGQKYEYYIDYLVNQWLDEKRICKYTVTEPGMDIQILFPSKKNGKRKEKRISCSHPQWEYWWDIAVEQMEQIENFNNDLGLDSDISKFLKTKTYNEYRQLASKKKEIPQGGTPQNGILQNSTNKKHLPKIKQKQSICGYCDQYTFVGETAYKHPNNPDFFCIDCTKKPEVFECLPPDLIPYEVIE